jgi:hypothetical protein
MTQPREYTAEELRSLAAGTRRKKKVYDIRRECEIRCLPIPEAEYEFHATRKWRFDFAFLEPHWLAVEIDGGGWVQGRHSRGKGMRDDCEKLCEAICAGWRVMRVVPEQIKSGELFAWLERVLV